MRQLLKDQVFSDAEDRLPKQTGQRQPIRQSSIGGMGTRRSRFQKSFSGQMVLTASLTLCERVCVDGFKWMPANMPFYETDALSMRPVPQIANASSMHNSAYAFR